MIDDFGLRSILTKTEQKLLFLNVFLLHKIRFYLLTIRTPAHTKKVHTKVQESIYLIKPFNLTGSVKILETCRCINGSIVKNIQEPVVLSSASDKPLGHGINKKLQIKLL